MEDKDNGFSQDTHLLADMSLYTKQCSHFLLSNGIVQMDAEPEAVVAAVTGVAVGRGRRGLSQETHLMAEESFCTKHTSHLIVLATGAQMFTVLVPCVPLPLPLVHVVAVLAI